LKQFVTDLISLEIGFKTIILVSEIPFLASVTNCYTSKMQYSPHFMRLNFNLNHSILTILGQWFFHILSHQAFGSTKPSNFFEQNPILSSHFVKSLAKGFVIYIFK